MSACRPFSRGPPTEGKAIASLASPRLSISCRTTSNVSAVCHAPGTKTKTGLSDADILDFGGRYVRGVGWVKLKGEPGGGKTTRVQAVPRYKYRVFYTDFVRIIDLRIHVG